MTDLANQIGAGLFVSASMVFAGALLFLSNEDAKKIVDESIETCSNSQKHELLDFGQKRSLDQAEYENCRQQLVDLVRSTDRTSRAVLAGHDITIEFEPDFKTVSDSTAAAYFESSTKQLHINLSREFDSQVQALDELGEWIGKQTRSQAPRQDSVNDTRSIIFGSQEKKVNVQAGNQLRL